MLGETSNWYSVVAGESDSLKYFVVVNGFGQGLSWGKVPWVGRTGLFSVFKQVWEGLRSGTSRGDSQKCILVLCIV